VVAVEVAWGAAWVGPDAVEDAAFTEEFDDVDSDERLGTHEQTPPRVVG
jgi:hypothetical protein